MARSTYIYIVYEDMIARGWFTVKHEAVRYAETLVEANRYDITIVSVKDGGGRDWRGYDFTARIVWNPRTDL